MRYRWKAQLPGLSLAASEDDRLWPIGLLWLLSSVSRCSIVDCDTGHMPSVALSIKKSHTAPIVWPFFRVGLAVENRHKDCTVSIPHHAGAFATLARIGVSCRLPWAYCDCLLAIEPLFKVARPLENKPAAIGGSWAKIGIACGGFLLRD